MNTLTVWLATSPSSRTAARSAARLLELIQRYFNHSKDFHLELFVKRLSFKKIRSRISFRKSNSWFLFEFCRICPIKTNTGTKPAFCAQTAGNLSWTSSSAPNLIGSTVAVAMMRNLRRGATAVVRSSGLVSYVFF